MMPISGSSVNLFLLSYFYFLLIFGYAVCLLRFFEFFNWKLDIVCEKIIGKFGTLNGIIFLHRNFCFLASKSLIRDWIDYILVFGFVGPFYFWFASTPRVESFRGPIWKLGVFIRDTPTWSTLKSICYILAL